MFTAIIALANFSGGPLVIESALGIQVPAAKRWMIRTDPVEALLVNGTWKTPREGDKCGVAAWKAKLPDASGMISGPEAQGGYVLWSPDVPSDSVYLLESPGATVAYVDGTPHGGDPYSTGMVALPVALDKGKHEILFQCGRGRLKASLTAVTEDLAIDLRDPTLPDHVEGAKGFAYGAVVVRNQARTRITAAKIDATTTGGATVQTANVSLPPMTARKVAFRFDASRGGALTIRLNAGRAGTATAEFPLRTVTPRDVRSVTFRSEIDGSIQYYAVRPSLSSRPGQALFLTLHGASVEARGQAEAYGPKTWGHIVAPTNRRPYGFDWEGVGRLDALEVLSHAQDALETDPTMTYLTGHSMGGHGTWQLGAHYPSRFAAIGPCAAWQSFWSYAGGANADPQSPVELMLRRAANASDTLLMKDNFAQQTIMVLHGDADDNVPVAEARGMRDSLKDVCRRLFWHEEKGQGHWYDTDPDTGADCVDYAPMFDLFARARIPIGDELAEIDFTTIDPGISAVDRWIEVSQQTHSLLPSRVRLRARAGLAQITGSTQNVASLVVNPVPLGEVDTWSIELDGQKIEGLGRGFKRFVFQGSRWMLSEGAVTAEKSPRHASGLKAVFANKVVFVYATGGGNDVRGWALSKAIFDAEQLWVRGNGSVSIVPDTDIASVNIQSNIVLYGNEDTNSAWKSLLEGCGVKPRKDSMTVFGRQFKGPDLGFMFVHPRPGSKAIVAAIGGTGLPGMRLTERWPIFLSGAGIPDVFVARTKMLESGSKGVVCAGFTSPSYQLSEPDMAWGE